MSEDYLEPKKILAVDITSLKMKELDQYIERVKEYRKEKTGCNTLSASECTMILMMSISEKNARSSTRLGWIAIGIALISGIFSVFT